MKSIILARVSTEDQKEAGYSLPAQVQRLKNYITRNESLTLNKQFVFDESAYHGDSRKQFEEVLEYIRNQKEVIAFCCELLKNTMTIYWNYSRTL
jgi:DNA invertase Pin-like site-specific DNA recombinase